jgi:hypothetical protein
MGSTRRKPARRGNRKRAPAGKVPRSRKQVPLAAELPVRQGLLEMATIGAQSLLWLTTLIVTAAVLAAAGFGVWSLRPVPAYSSERVTTGSAFAVTFHVENTSPWFPLVHLNISCVLAGVDAPAMPSVVADISRIPARLEPGQQASFTCPFRAADPEVALRSELYFRSDYDLPANLPWLGTLRLSDNRGPFVLDARLLPPRWTAKPGKD